MIWIRLFRRVALVGVALSAIVLVVHYVTMLTSINETIKQFEPNEPTVRKFERVFYDVAAPIHSAASLFFPAAAVFVLCEIAMILHRVNRSRLENTP